MMKIFSCWPEAGTTTKPFSQPLLLWRSLFTLHVEFLHVQVEPGEAAGWEPHAEFLRGSAIRETILVSGQPPGTAVSANWREEMGDAERRLMFSAGHHDLVVLGRRT
jgi:hypothetical protein